MAGEFVVKWACVVVVGQPHETVVVAWVRVVVVVKWALEVVGQSSNKSVIVVVHDQDARLGKRRAVVVDLAT